MASIPNPLVLTDAPHEFTRATSLRSSAPSAVKQGVPGLDGMIVFLAGALMVVGIVMVYSASVSLDGPGLQMREWWRSPLKQSIFAIAGFVAMLFASQIDYRIFCWRPRLGGLLPAL